MAYIEKRVIYPSKTCTTKSRIWISWENHRRTKELAKALDTKLIILKSNAPKGFSHFFKSLSTTNIILRERPKVLIVQNPSRILAALAGVLKIIFGYKFIVDRHTNFRIGKSIGLDIRILLLTLFSNFSLKAADLTIVTNKFLIKLVERKGGTGFVIPDKIPDLKRCNNFPVAGKKNITYICTFANDEPYLEVIKAAKKLTKDIYIYITGNFKKSEKNIVNSVLPSNLVLAGYLSEQDYVNLLFSSDFILVLTKADWCLVCGGYEAMAAEKPFITSKKRALVDFYGSSAIFTENESTEIVDAINSAINRQDEMRSKIKNLKIEKEIHWEEQFDMLKQLIQ